MAHLTHCEAVNSFSSVLSSDLLSTKKGAVMFIDLAALSCFRACLFIYRCCRATSWPPPIILSRSPPGPLVIDSYSSTHCLSNSAGDNLSSSFGEFKSSSISKSRRLSNSLARLSLRAFGRTANQALQVRTEKKNTIKCNKKSPHLCLY